MRGKLFGVVLMGFGAGITPAGAGKTANAQPKRRMCQDHPRRCGENYEVALDTGAIRGSPPQVRGKRIRLQNGMQN